MERNKAAKWVVYAIGLEGHATPGRPITGDAANITANVRIDGGTATATTDTNPTELEDGAYVFDLTAAETNGELISLHPVSSTPNVQVIAAGGAVWTRPTNFNALSIEADGSVSETDLAAETLDAIADAILKRDFSAVSGESARSMLNALRAIRNRWYTNAGQMIVTAEDDTTIVWTGQIQSTPNGEMITGVNPN